MSAASDDMLRDVFTTALEGGIGYWSQAETYHWDDPNPSAFYADIVDIEDEDAKYHIDISVIRRGINMLNEVPLGDPYQKAAAHDLYWGHEMADYDADTADFIVQLGLFGEVVYG